MNNIIFAKTRYHYQSYTDFWSLVELSGYKTVYLDEIDFQSGDIYIFAPKNGELDELYNTRRSSFKDRTSKIFHWNLERPGGSGDLLTYIRSNRELVQQDIVDRVIVSDKALADVSGFSFVPVGSHRGLSKDIYPGLSKHVRNYDFIHLSCYSNRRAFLFNTPVESHKTIAGCKLAENGWGDDRHKKLLTSKFMLNIHQDDFTFIEPLRFALAAAYGLIVVTERCTDITPYHIDEVIQLSHPGASPLAREQFDKNLQYISKHWNVDAGNSIYRRWTGTHSFANCLEKYL